MSEKLTRRELIRNTSLYGGGLTLTLQGCMTMTEQAAMRSGRRQELSAREWLTIEAMTGRIIPTDHQPGALEANCVNFIDKALAYEEKGSRKLVKSGAGGLDKYCRREFDLRFSELSAGQQDSVLVMLEDGAVEDWSAKHAKPGEFFELVRVLTILGFLADPKYG